MPSLHVSRLGEFLDAVGRAGGNYNHETVAQQFYPLEIQFDTKIDESISSFSDEYFEQQRALYQEIAARSLNQEEGELHVGDIEWIFDNPNPTGMAKPGRVAGQVRALASMLAVADLGEKAHVLDMGAGHGTSAEVYAFCGCQVHAVDIDAKVVDLGQRRSDARSLGVCWSNLNFDDISPLEDGKYEAAFFFQSMHHCLRLWDLIEQLKHKLTEHGVIGFVGEPIQSHWWKNWGLRLDPESIVMARTYGWFESGWSHAFLIKLFERSGMVLQLFTGGEGRGEIGIAAKSLQRARDVAARAEELGLSPVLSGGAIPDTRFASSIGTKAMIQGRPGFVQDSVSEGMLLYGPYTELEGGLHSFSLVLEHLGSGEAAQLDASAVIDVVSHAGQKVHFREQLSAQSLNQPMLIARKFHLPGTATDVEVRVQVFGSGRWAATLPLIDV